ncbi:MAG TPA: hypothetical protein VM223_18175 [Planctomycetota bacterium]|nr:hypothetical protein [Planctomycetota bacterium]
MTTKKPPMQAEAAEDVIPTSEDRLTEMEVLVKSLASTQETLNARLRQSEGEKEQLAELLASAVATRDERVQAGSPPQPKVELLHDPYDVQNPLSIIKDMPPSDGYPMGQKLSWKDPQYRDNSRGWKGWIPIRFEDEIDLTEFIPDPPQRFMGETEMDGFVRRCGLVLSRLDMRIFKARDASRERKSDEMRGLTTSAAPVIFDRDGIRIDDEGTHSEANKPSFGVTPEPLSEYSHRKSFSRSPDAQAD